MKQQLFVRERAHSKYRAYVVEGEGGKNFRRFAKPLHETDFDSIFVIIRV